MYLFHFRTSAAGGVFTLRVGGISVGLCDFLYCCVCKQLLHAFVSKCDFFNEGKVKIHYYVSHIFDSHVTCQCKETYILACLTCFHTNSVAVPQAEPYI